MKTYLISPDAETKISAWLSAGRGVAVWTVKDLGSSSLGGERFTPGDAPSPHWNCGQTADEIITDAARFAVETVVEVAQVKIRRGPPYNGGVNRADRPRLDKALETAGLGAYWLPDYERAYGSAWFTARIMRPVSTRPITLS